jgi:hypothetical protein
LAQGLLAQRQLGLLILALNPVLDDHFRLLC